MTEQLADVLQKIIVGSLLGAMETVADGAAISIEEPCCIIGRLTIGIDGRGTNDIW